MTQTDRELFARLTLESNLALGEHIERRRQRRPRVDFTTPGFVYPERKVEAWK
jgi:ABC-type branched-subunit amino acid transport system ATPase component